MFYHTIERIIHIDALIMGIDVVRPKNFYFPGETHDFWEAVYVCDGNVTATADERVYRLSSGNLLFHKPMEFHRIWTDEESAPHLMILSFKAGGNGMRRFENSCFELSPSQRKRLTEITAHFPPPPPTDDDIVQTDPLTLNRAASMLEMLLLDLMDRPEYSGHTMTGDESQYARIVNVMKQNCDRTLSVEDLAQLCNLGVSNMKRIFACFSDVGIAKYFLSLKVRRAMELLDEGMPASKVAEALDFSEISYFYTVFKRETGMTPTQYKKSHPV